MSQTPAAPYCLTMLTCIMTIHKHILGQYSQSIKTLTVKYIFLFFGPIRSGMDPRLYGSVLNLRFECHIIFLCKYYKSHETIVK